MQLDHAVVREVVARALAEDLGGPGDITARSSVPPNRRGAARVVAKERAIVAGIPVARVCFTAVDPQIDFEVVRDDGDEVAPGDVVFRAQGRAAALLAAERTALNFLQRLSGIATATRAHVDALRGTRVRIFDTRKTTPGLRVLEKYAVRVGGGHNHRIGLFDQVLLKENHFALARPRSYQEVVQAAVASATAPVVAEARDLDEAIAAVRGGAAVVLLDNFQPGPELASAVRIVREEADRLHRSVEIEASGGITLGNLHLFATSGVDRVSVGALTHSVKAIDLSMLIEGVG